MPGYKDSALWEAKVQQASPLGVYVVKGIQTQQAESCELRLEVPEPRFPRRENLYAAPWHSLLQMAAMPLTAACVAGGCKLLVDLLKVWVEERKGRVIKIKDGEKELEIRGGMGVEEVEAISELFEKKFPNPSILR